jgi:hypothetical protein
LREATFSAQSGMKKNENPDFCTLPKIRKGESSSLIEALDYNTIAQIVRIAVMKSL